MDENGETLIRSISPLDKGPLSVLPFADLIRKFIRALAHDSIPDGPFATALARSE
jgi:hypothetical protein